MPYSPAQNRLFWAASKNPDIAAAHGMTMDKAKMMAQEGVTNKSTSPKPRKPKTNALTEMVMP